MATAADSHLVNNDIERNGGYGHHGVNGVNGSGAAAYSHRKIANPAPLGLFSFASTTLILSFINAHARSVRTPNIVVGMALGVGGLVQLLAGMWEFACGNTFGATAFSSYGGFWLSFGLIYWPSSGILAAYSGDNAHQLEDAVGIWLMSWFIFTTIMFFGTLRATGALSALFFFLSLTFMLLMIGAFARNVGATKAGGVLGIITAAIAYYTAAHGIITRESGYFGLPAGDLPKRADATTRY